MEIVDLPIQNGWIFQFAMSVYQTHMLHGAGIFTYIWVILFGQMCVNIPAPWFAYGRPGIFFIVISHIFGRRGLKYHKSHKIPLKYP